MIEGFSKQDKPGKIKILQEHVPLQVDQVKILEDAVENPTFQQGIIEKISEQYISNYVLPFSVCPNFLINDKFYFVPMVTEESSVVAAASFSAKFWAKHGGFRCKVLDTKKVGQVFFNWKGDTSELYSNFPSIKDKLLQAAKPLVANMKKRGGGILTIDLENTNNNEPNYYEIKVEFETVDSMGANFINTCLEVMASELKNYLDSELGKSQDTCEIIMAILSNYTPECLVECRVECDIEQLPAISGNLSASDFARKFKMAVDIARENLGRAVTHNKGIFNGIDGVLIATGNDFRAVEACGHAYASREGKYSSLTSVEMDEKKFKYTLIVPLALGTVGGTSSVHPMAQMALQIMNQPSAKELMQVVAAAGMANNFSAVRSLITEGIQKGHMRLHLDNILNTLQASVEEKKMVKEHFTNKPVSFHGVKSHLLESRNSFAEKNK